MVSRRRLLGLALGAALLGPGVVGGYRYEETVLRVELLPRGVRVVHVTDLHIHRGIPGWLLRRITRIRPTILVVTGDTWDELTPWPPSAAIEALRKLAHYAKEAYAVLGNHEHWAARRRGADPRVEAGRLYGEAGFQLLVDEATMGAGGVRICGLDWRDEPAGYGPALRRLLRRGCDLVVAHSPDVFHFAEPSVESLYLTGHTHGGQVCLPGGRSLYTNSHYGYRWGLYTRGGSLMYVSRGLGEMLPPRLYCSRELVLAEPVT